MGYPCGPLCWSSSIQLLRRVQSFCPSTMDIKYFFSWRSTSFISFGTRAAPAHLPQTLMCHGFCYSKSQFPRGNWAIPVLPNAPALYRYCSILSEFMQTILFYFYSSSTIIFAGSHTFLIENIRLAAFLGLVFAKNRILGRRRAFFINFVPQRRLPALPS